jgi:hypothetical protein
VIKGLQRSQGIRTRDPLLCVPLFQTPSLIHKKFLNANFNYHYMMNLLVPDAKMGQGLVSTIQRDGSKVKEM